MRFLLAAISAFTLFGACGMAMMSKDGPAMWFAVVGVGALLLLIVLKPRRSHDWRDDPPTVKQIRFADELGIEYPDDITKGELSDLISEKTGQ